ncbi:MAG: histidine phosphatase family protein [Micropepsaceae bacterium]
MARLYLVRHAEPAGTWADSADPGLTERGREQAKAAADRLRLVQPKQIVTSPLRRAVETAMPLSFALSMQPLTAPQVAEIPTPANMSLEHRSEWLRGVMSRNWAQADPVLREWRDSVVSALTRLQVDTAVYSHFVAINAALGASIGDDRVLCFHPAHTSVTILETNGKVLSLVELGETAETTVR